MVVLGRWRGPQARRVSSTDETFAVLKQAHKELVAKKVPITRRVLCKHASTLWPLKPGGFNAHITRSLGDKQKKEIGLL